MKSKNLNRLTMIRIDSIEYWFAQVRISRIIRVPEINPKFIAF